MGGRAGTWTLELSLVRATTNYALDKLIQSHYTWTVWWWKRGRKQQRTPRGGEEESKEKIVCLYSGVVGGGVHHSRLLSNRVDVPVHAL